MQISKVDKVVFLKDVESNIIQDAFVVLKKDIKFERAYNNKQDSLKTKREECILKEAENIINSEINKFKFEYNKFKIQKLEKKLKFQKKISVFLIVLLIISIIIK